MSSTTSKLITLLGHFSKQCSRRQVLSRIESSDLSPRNQRTLGTIIRYLPELKFLALHYLYFIIIIILASVIFWGSSTPASSVDYIDCLFLVTSAMTETGLNTYNLSQLNTFQQIILFFLIILGSYVTITVYVLFARKRAFEHRFTEMLELFKAEKEETSRMRRSTNFITMPFARRSSDMSRRPPSGLPPNRRQPSCLSTVEGGENNRSGEGAQQDESPYKSGNIDSQDRVKKYGHYTILQRDVNNKLSIEPTLHEAVSRSSAAVRFRNVSDFDPIETASHTQFAPPIKEVLNRAIVGRNASMHVIGSSDREHLGGAEYRAVRLFCWVVPLYYIFWQACGCLALTLYMGFQKADIARGNGQDPWWLGIFLGVSAFNNCGLTLLDLGMAQFQENYFVPLTLCVLILLGNVAYPIFLRLILWIAYKTLSSNEGNEATVSTLKFALDYPRRVYTSMFPSAHTWWLLLVLIVLTAVDWVGLTVLNLTNAALLSIPPQYRVVDDFFQSVSIRTVGFGIFSISNLTVGNQVLLLIMMYISAYPFAITLRSSNVYEERSLGIFKRNQEASGTTEKARRISITSADVRTGSRLYFLRAQLSNQLSHDMWWLAIAIFAITCIEVDSYNADPKIYAVFNIIFEVISAYGPVGLSTGLNDKPYSLSGGFHAASKLIICAVMLRGRHRGLPIAIDKAIKLPGDKSDRIEQEQWEMSRTVTVDDSRFGGGVAR